ncbi:inositol monophosphatase family protein [Limnochorda pilosa]|uniref:Inositol-1-monophosphatase n=1 Tax=Limnochorda pilosa TaxID=1555112 RepID=A0A0K2SNZ6_LIMPI|nr:inositol monophosphatase family protein [Limnochorda pilosa]BAS28826.1 histidinol-phosphate phosphatase [Limnochorda pilosa]
MDLEAPHRLAVTVAREAGGLLLERFGRAHTVEHKGPTDLVTEADRLSEEHILARIRESYPGHAILSEEAGLQERSGGLRWIVDPLDGTTNFAHGLPLFSVSIALEVDGELAVGVVYDPAAGELFDAVRGRGARLNGRPVHVSAVDTLQEALLVTGFPYDLWRDEGEDNLDYFARFARRCQGVRRLGSAALDLAYVAAGRLDGYWELKIHAWDIAAGALLVQEAGGRLSTLDGDPFRVDGGRILASNGHLHEAMLQVLARGRLGGEGGRP